MFALAGSNILKNQFLPYNARVSGRFIFRNIVPQFFKWEK
jgi:hypothetical protein